MAYTAGTSGRIACVAVTPDLSTDKVDYTTALSSLASGATTTAVVAEVTEWSLEITQSGGAESRTLESPTTANGRVLKEVYRGGTEEYAFEIRGQLNGTTTTGKFVNGAFVAANFLVKKNTASGYSGVVGEIQNFRVTGTNATDGKLVMFSCRLNVSGALPAFA